MLVVETVGRIRREHLVRGKSIKEIARALKISRNTVRKVLRSGATSFAYEREVQPRPKLGRWKGDLERMLEQNVAKPARERLTLIRVFEELRALGYEGGYDAVRRYARVWAKGHAATSAETYVPLAFAAGEAFQFDWSHEVVLIGGVTSTVKVAHLRLCHSRMLFVRAYPRESQEMVFDAHDRAFAFFKGACRRGIYDNMKTAVETIFVGKDRAYNRRFLQMCAHHLVEPVACTPAPLLEQVDERDGLHEVDVVLADRLYDLGPRLNNELLNRIKPSSNAIAAQKELLKVMIEQAHEPRLGIEGFPAVGGLYASLFEATGLHAARPDDPSRWQFVEPPADGAARLAPLWRAADALFGDAGSSGRCLDALFDLWRKPPYGVRDGLLPVLAMAFLMSRAGQLAVYLDGAFQPKVTPMLIDRLTQDPASVRLRWTEISDFHRRVLGDVADLVAEFRGMAPACDEPQTIDVARGLVGIVLRLPAWVLRTGRLSPSAANVRNLAKLASDPNKFLLDDLPAVFAEGSERVDAARVAAALREGLAELVEAYPNMLRELEDGMLRELRAQAADHDGLADLHRRAGAVRGLTGNYRLDAFSTRLASFGGTDEEMEGIASLAANKPPKDWVDRDIDHARIEIAALAQEFAKAEALAHVKGRRDGRVAMAIYISDPSRASPVRPEFDVSAAEAREVGELAADLHRVVKRSGLRRDVALAALAELGAMLTELAAEPVLALTPPEQRVPARRRSGARG